MNDTISKIKDSIEISAINGGALLVSMSDAEQILRMLSLSLAVVYTACRVFSLWKKNRNN